MKNKSLINNILSRFLDSIFYALLSSVFSFVFIALFFTDNADVFLPQIIIFNLIAMSYFSIINISKKTFIFGLIFPFVIFIFYILFSGIDNFSTYFTGFIDFINNAQADLKTISDKIYGTILIYLISFLFLIPVIVIYYLTRFKKVILITTITLLISFIALSIIFTEISFVYAFIVVSLSTLWIYSKSLFLNNNDENQTFLKFQFKRVKLSFIPVLALLIAVQVFPINYQSQPFINSVNSIANNIENLFKQTFDDGYSSVTLGGDLIQTGETHFQLRNRETLYLKTNAYDYYTGMGFNQSEELKVRTPYEDLQDMTFPTTDEDDTYNSSLAMLERESDLFYNLKFVDNSMYRIPNISPFIEIIEFNTENNFSYNELGEIFYNDFFKENDTLRIGASHFNYDRGMPVSDSSHLSTYYLQLPDTITDRTRDLAQSLKINLLNQMYINDDTRYNFLSYFPQDVQTYLMNAPESERLEFLKLYDTSIFNNEIASFIAYYLHETYEYTKTPRGEVGSDFVDSFLFDIQEGYCSAFATSMVVLLRSIGIPCRYIEGYYVSSTGADYKNITDYEFHAWVEIWEDEMSPYIYDPTNTMWLSTKGEKNILTRYDSSIDLIDRVIFKVNSERVVEPTEPLEDTEPTTSPNEPTNATTQTPTQNATTESSTTKPNESNSLDITNALIIIGVLLALSLTITVYIFYKNKLIKNTLASNNTDVVYKSMIMLLSSLKIMRVENETIREFMLRVFTHDFTFDLKDTTKFNLLNENQEEMQQIIDAVEKHLYSKDKVNVKELKQFRNKINAYALKKHNIVHYLIKFKKVK